MPLARTIMIQGTSSHVGKSILCTALCRIFNQDGFRVAPFKAQNMALNSYVTADGGEIGRAQGAQADAAGVMATVKMNPVLIKPKQDLDAQIVVLGKPLADMSAREYRANFLPKAVGLVEQCINELRQDFEVLVIEGAGSPAEVNLKDRDIVNMRTAFLSEAPVILAADIDRGGVFAALVGTLELLEPHEREKVAGFIINKFRGDIELLRPGLDFLEQRTGKPVLGVIPYLHEHGIEQEDSVSLADNKTVAGTELDIAVIKLPRISNFTDFDALSLVPGVAIRFVGPGESLGKPDAVILPGTKNTIQDLLYLREKGLDTEIKALAKAGVPIVGICGGYQMMGKMLYDPWRSEAGIGDLPGLGLLDIETTFWKEKQTHRCSAKISCTELSWCGITNQEIKGYEIHTGQVTLGKQAQSLLKITHRSGVPTSIEDGAATREGLIFGTHLHGLFDNTELLLDWINFLRSLKGLEPLTSGQLPLHKGDKYDKLADVVRQHLDMEKLYSIMGLGVPSP